MKLTGAIYQTNEAPTAGILGYHSHRSPAIWNQHLVPARKFNVELGTHDIHSTAPILRREWSTKHLQYSILGLWSAHNSSLRPPHPAESNMVHDQCCASYAMPCVLAVTRFKSLSHRLDVDLSVLRANFTGWRRGSRIRAPTGYPSMRLCQPGYAIVHTPQLDLFNRQEGSSKLSLDMHCPISKVTKLPIIVF